MSHHNRAQTALLLAAIRGRTILRIDKFSLVTPFSIVLVAVPTKKSVLIEGLELAARRGRVQWNVRTTRFPARRTPQRLHRQLRPFCEDVDIVLEADPDKKQKL